MDSKTTQTNAVAKLPLLKQGEYEMWRLRIEQYFQIQDYAPWDIIENGNSFNLVARTTTNTDDSSTSTIPGPVTTKEKTQKKNDVKAKSMLLMALTNEHQLTFNQYKDAKTLFATIQIRFGGNDAIKKTQKTLLKQMYENFNAQSTKSLDSIFNRLQKIVSYLEMSFDDLYNNFKIVEQEVKRTVTSSSNSGSQNMAFRTGKKININGSYTAGYDNSKVECFNCHKMGHFARECRAMVAIDGAGFDWSYMADEEVPTNLALMPFLDSEIEKFKKEKESNQIKIDNFENASKSLDKLIGSQISNNNRKGVGYNVVPPPPTGLFAPSTIDLSNFGLKEFQQPEFEGYVFKANKGVCKNSSNEIKKTTYAPIIEDWVSDCDEDESEVRILKSDNVQQKPNQANQPRKVSENPRRNFVPTAVLTKCGKVSVSGARSINNAEPKSFVNAAKTRPNAFQKSHSPSRRPFYQQTTLKNRNLNDKVNTSKINSVNTAKGNKVTSAVGEQGINDVKSSACWVWRPKIKCWLYTTQQMVINSPCLIDKKELAIQGQMTTGKE
ncbi:ribonuclease H-like domain-containing protein [Tanacetum coccineum]